MKYTMAALICLAVGVSTGAVTARAQENGITTTVHGSEAIKLTATTFHSEVMGSSSPVIVLVTSPDCKTCADTEAQYSALAKRYPNVKFTIADIALFTDAPIPPERIKYLPSVMTFPSNGQPILYTKVNVDKVQGGFDALIQARVSALIKLSQLDSEAHDIDTQIEENRRTFARYDGLRKPSDRATRVQLNNALAALYERKANLVRERTPVLEDENDAGPSVTD
ncbi:MAG TPA: thioredoxin domain-containing protein [Drouetiella sp.]